MRLSKTRQLTIENTNDHCIPGLTEPIRAERKAFGRLKFKIVQEATKKPNRKKDKSARRPRTVEYSRYIIRSSMNTNKYPYNPLITKKAKW
jgi:hypothetical protein